MLEQEVKDVEASRTQPGSADDPDVHLAHLLTPASLDAPWYKTFVKSVKEAINPPKLPPLVVTSKPLEVGEFWGFYGGNEKKAGTYSILIHLAAILLILWIGSLKPVQKMIANVTPLFAPDLKPYLPEQAKTDARRRRRRRSIAA